MTWGSRNTTCWSPIGADPPNDLEKQKHYMLMSNWSWPTQWLGETETLHVEVQLELTHPMTWGSRNTTCWCPIGATLPNDLEKQKHYMLKFNWSWPTQWLGEAETLHVEVQLELPYPMTWGSRNTTCWSPIGATLPNNLGKQKHYMLKSNWSYPTQWLGEAETLHVDVQLELPYPMTWGSRNTTCWCPIGADLPNDLGKQKHYMLMSNWSWPTQWLGEAETLHVEVQLELTHPMTWGSRNTTCWCPIGADPPNDLGKQKHYMLMSNWSWPTQWLGETETLHVDVQLELTHPMTWGSWNTTCWSPIGADPPNDLGKQKHYMLMSNWSWPTQWLGETETLHADVQLELTYRMTWGSRNTTCWCPIGADLPNDLGKQKHYMLMSNWSWPTQWLGEAETLHVDVQLELTYPMTWGSWNTTCWCPIGADLPNYLGKQKHYMLKSNWSCPTQWLWEAETLHVEVQLELLCLITWGNRNTTCWSPIGATLPNNLGKQKHYMLKSNWSYSA